MRPKRLSKFYEQWHAYSRRVHGDEYLRYNEENTIYNEYVKLLKKANNIDTEIMKDYTYEARSRWGNTDAYREHEQKTKNYTKEKWAEANDGLMAIFAEFAAVKASGAHADSAEAQALAAKLQAHITEHYYTCTKDILAGLGKMYVADERFKNNIDKYGEGTAELVAEAIAIFCGNV